MFRRGASGSRAGLRLGELMVVLDYNINILSLERGGGTKDTRNDEETRIKDTTKSRRRCTPKWIADRDHSPPTSIPLPHCANDNRPRLGASSTPFLLTLMELNTNRRGMSPALKMYGTIRCC
jgi:hypothetical protein